VYFFNYKQSIKANGAKIKVDFDETQQLQSFAIAYRYKKALFWYNWIVGE